MVKINALIIFIGSLWLVKSVFMVKQLANDKFGPFDIVYKYIDDCGGEGAFVRFHLRSRRVSRKTVVLEGTITAKATPEFSNVTEMTDYFKLKTVLQQFTPSGWKDNFAIADYGDAGTCTLMDNFISGDEKKRLTSGVINMETNETMNTRCPIYFGDYIVTGLEFTMSGLNRLPKKFFYGQYRAIFHGYYRDHDHEVVCVCIYADVVPKRNNG